MMRKAAEIDRANLWANNRLSIDAGFDEHALNRFLMAPRFMLEVGVEHARFVEQEFSASRSQLFQDLFVLIRLEKKRRGFFVEVGVGDGEYLSNTWILEKKYEWRGILAEPNRAFVRKIRMSRSADLDNRAVWHTTGDEVSFLDVEGNKELSTIDRFQNSDRYLRHGETYSVKTVSLNDLLALYQAPREIDYMSIDTEGSECEVLEGLDFDRYRVSVFTVEHNFQKDKLRTIDGKMARHGYKRVHAGFSRFDAWYVSNTLFRDMNAAARNQNERI